MNEKLPLRGHPHFCRWLFMAIALMVAFEAHSQGVVVRGKVTNPEGESIPGANVAVQGTNLGTVTDAGGDYSIQLPNENQTLVFSFIGYVSQEVAVNGRSVINIQLESDLRALEEVVIIGYGSVKKTDLTGSVGQVNVEELVKAPVATFTEALAGRVAGVRVAASDGQPGGGMEIVIRGAGSLTQSTSPLYVIDGFPVEDLDPATLNPEDIESMTILKDASSTAVYGSRAANGVILINTKRGMVGAPVVTLSTSYGFQQNPKKMELMNAYEFVKYQSELNPIVPGATGVTANTAYYFANDKTLRTPSMLVSSEVTRLSSLV